MTYHEFEQKIKKKTGFDKYWYYGLCIATIAFCSYLILHFATHPEKFKTKASFIFICVILSLLVGLAAFGLHKLPNRYKIVAIDTSQPLTKKKKAIETLLSQMGATTTLSEDYCSFTYRKNFWSSPYDVYLFFDDNSICFSVQGQDYFNGGFIDFGETEKLRKKLADEIQTYLM